MKMKIKEFIEKVNDRDGMQATKTDAGIVISTPRNNGIFIIPEDATNFLEIENWTMSNRVYLKKPDREYLSALIEELLHTPIKERYSENKYHLRWINDDDGTSNYLCNFSGTWDWSITKRSTDVFTEKELQQLKINNPKLAPAIEAMKEPVDE